MEPLVSIIMPAYNAERWIDEAIRSVLAQTHTNWELVIVNDGSTDKTAAIIGRFQDMRIRVFHKSNGGIGSARNLALDRAKGNFICGLDADDVLPPQSIADRLTIFSRHPETDIVDGSVLFMDGSLSKVLQLFTPTFVGHPFNELLALTGSCFMGFSWLIRWDSVQQVRFDEQLSHGEDLLFYLRYAPGKYYRSTASQVLFYRRTGSSAMSDLSGLEQSYRHILAQLELEGYADRASLALFRKRTRTIMITSYLKAGNVSAALRCLASGRNWSASVTTKRRP